MDHSYNLNNLSIKLKTAVLATVSATALMTTPLYAQTTSGETIGENEFEDEIVVTARRGEEVLSDVPLSIDVIGDEEIDKYDINNLEDIVKFSPALAYAQNFRPEVTQLGIRGLTTDVGRSAVALRINDVDVTAEAIGSSGLGYFPNQRLLDLERVEVVKGAQVALYGRSAFGGSLNFVSKRPDLETWNGTVKVGASTEYENEVGVKLNGPIVEGKVGLGLVAANWYDDGSHKNQLSGDRLGGTEGSGAAVTLFVKPNDQLSGFFRAEVSDDNPEPIAGVTISPNTTITLSDEAAAIIGSPSTAYFVGEAPSVSEDQLAHALNPLDETDYPGTEREYSNFTGDIEYDLGGVSVRSLTGFFAIDTETWQTTAFQPQPYVNPDGSLNAEGTGAIVPGMSAQSFWTDTETRITTQEIQLFSNDSDARFRWLIGGLYWEEEIDSVNDQEFVIPTGEVSTADINRFFRENLFDGTRKFYRETRHLSAFAWAEFDLTEQLSVSLEGRYADEEVFIETFDTVNVSLGEPGANPGDPAIFTQINTAGVQEPGNVKESFFVPKGVITYRPNDDWMMYASVARSVKPAGHTSSGSTTFNEFTFFEEEQLWSYEVGTKATLADGKITIDGAVYYLDYTNQQVASTVLDPESNLPRPATENAGESRLFGVDIEFILRPTENLTVSGGYVFTDAEFTDFEFFTSSAGSAAEGPCTPLNEPPLVGCIISLDGNSPRQTPEHKFQIFGNYTTPIGNDFELFVEPSMRYSSKRYLTKSNLNWAPDFTRVDLRAGVTSKNWRLTAYVENVLDDDTPTDVFQFLDYQAGFAPAAIVILPEPIKFGIDLNYDF